MLSFRLVTLFALVHITSYKSAITLGVLDAALYDAHTYITSAVTYVPVSWSPHTVLEDRPDLSPPEIAIGTLGCEGELPLFGCALLAALFLEDTDPDEPEPQPASGPARFLFDCLMDYEP
ncbi:hypothetical protein RhiJN_09931 [Ceratobasidium sp. AG-Ba]|nr:hypothetical protein RhiJN_09931 [Ceratobasidium sp. AG-Ba]QRW10693.1 hypothetical protein RhiLY_09692 [Ceratobasidium sp. AG-Ba]